MSPPNRFVDEKTLDKIDKLFSAGIGDYISLPQLVVVGDQSSGKSSVLEGLTSLPFPRDSGLCTRFATQITFRRAQTVAISVSIIPAKETSHEDSKRLRAWQKKGLTKLDANIFADIMREVNNVMQLREADGRGGLQTFSQDVLKLDISGPNEEHFSIVDVPGIFRVATEGVTTDSDKRMVRSMVEGYMSNPRCVILAVIPANVDVATQEILTLAKQHDPKGRRTIGVLTKPDLVDQGAEKAVMDLVNGSKHKLNLGWSIVRNLAQNQLLTHASERANLEEDFFRSTDPWKLLHKDRVGVASLKHRLAEVLASLIRDEFPKVKQEINSQLIEARSALASLGVSRQGYSEQLRYLIGISAKFEALAKDAREANYAGNDWFDALTERRLATFVLNQNEKLELNLRERGKTYRFTFPEKKTGRKTKPNDAPARNPFGGGAPVTPGFTGFTAGGAKAPNKANNVTAPQDDISDDDSDQDEEDDGEGDKSNSSLMEVDSSSQISYLNFFEDPDLMHLGISKNQTDVRNTKRGIMEWIKEEYRGCRSNDLGTINPHLIATIMKAQSSNWEGIALGYISDVIAGIHNFIKDLLTHVCPEERVRDALISELMDGLLQRYRDAVQNARQLLYTERQLPMGTNNHYYNDNMVKAEVKFLRPSISLLMNYRRGIRTRKAVESKSFAMVAFGADQKVVRFDDIGASENMSNTDYAVAETHDILKSYYKVALKRFADNLYMQSVNYHLLNGPDTPLNLLSPEFISNLSVEKVAFICEEDVMMQRERTDLKEKLERLEKARKIIV